MNDFETPLIFLDIDGVLNTDIYTGKLNSKLFNPACVYEFNNLIRDTKAKIVISSSNRVYGIATIRDWFKSQKVEGEIIDITPFGKDLQTRGQEIAHWLYTYNNPSNYIIIDDRNNGIPELFGDKFIKTKSRIGFTNEHYQLAKKLLTE